MKKILLLAIIAVAILPNAFAQLVAGPQVMLSDLTFSPTSIFAYNKRDSLQTFCLLGKGFLKAAHSPNSNQVISAWVAKHPKAQVIPIVTYSPFTPTHPGAKQTYCWLVDNKDTLNTYLVRSGCFAGSTMYRPSVGDERDTVEREMYSDIVLHMHREGYNNFTKQVASAQKYAKRNKLGVWKRKGRA